METEKKGKVTLGEENNGMGKMGRAEGGEKEGVSNQ